jgi:hypothetical protein
LTQIKLRGALVACHAAIGRLLRRHDCRGVGESFVQSSGKTLMGTSFPLVFVTDRWETIVVRLLPQQFLRLGVLGGDAAPWTWINRRRSQHVSRPFPFNGVDASRERLKDASQRVEQTRRLVSAWRDLTQGEQAAGRDVSVGRDLLKTFEARLEIAMSQQAEAEKALAQVARPVPGGQGPPAEERSRVTRLARLA